MEESVITFSAYVFLGSGSKNVYKTVKNSSSFVEKVDDMSNISRRYFNHGNLNRANDNGSRQCPMFSTGKVCVKEISFAVLSTLVFL